MSCHDRHDVRVRLVLLICICNGIIEVTTAYSDRCLMLILLQYGMTALMRAVLGHSSIIVEHRLDGGGNTEIRDRVCDVMSCHVMSCHIISYDRRSLTHLSEALCMP